MNTTPVVFGTALLAAVIAHLLLVDGDAFPSDPSVLRGA
jgi:hypothetical protein